MSIFDTKIALIVLYAFIVKKDKKEVSKECSGYGKSSKKFPQLGKLSAFSFYESENTLSRLFTSCKPKVQMK